MKTIKELTKNIKIIQTIGDLELPVAAICFDTREVVKGSLFAAQKGTKADGHTFIEQAIEKGASCVVVEKMPETIRPQTCYIQVASSQYALGVLASNFYDNPSQQLQLVGVTGTNGKTTTVTLLQALFLDLGYKAGLISTIENKINQQIIPTTHTTPNAVKINQLLREMADEGCEYCFMEVSSHAIVQERIAGLTFAGAAFTNITHEHLDYHKTFKEYIAAKKLFFDHLPKSAFALTNIDDANGKVMVQNTKATRKTYSLQNANCDFKAKLQECSLDGTNMTVDGVNVWCRLIGKFNAYNLLCIYSIARLLGMDKNEALTQISKLKPAQGRFETIENKGITVVVDYAHTPDALLNVLKTLNAVCKNNQDIVCVFGCGGDRDKTKRPQMAKIACRLSHRVIITSDNPRTENPSKIISDIYKGIPQEDEHKVIMIEDRRQAINAAISTAKTGSIVLIAGKGHEDYQEINGVRHHFDDMETAKQYLLKIKN
ncbi:MAG: UDP-N-acetylmuramoyl-L-alanyl-D-glutamate--2,6-diaminopimelate ligase [Lentimicrobiaceae bacterium]|nr:UDP-N-acetylmuramoyl-L-alanyl-D-glutamate--2,6-diaminopimelate ligase [Lentimicrobiaceae bacterium]